MVDLFNKKQLLKDVPVMGLKRDILDIDKQLLQRDILTRPYFYLF